MRLFFPFRIAKEILILILILTGCRQSKTDSLAEVRSIQDCWRDWGKKADAGNPGFYWADDMVMMSPGSPVIRGKKAFLEMLGGMPKDSGFKLVCDSLPSQIEISRDGTMAYLFAENRIVRKDSAGRERVSVNQAIQIWRKDSLGNWRSAVSVMYPE